MPDLSVLIPARNEMFLQRTIDDVQKNIRADTEIIVVLDGYWPEKPIPKQPNLTVIHRPVSIGQRAATNEAARVSAAPYIMKLDAHCAMGEGFDEVLLASVKELGDDVLQVPTQYNLYAFDWVCEDGHKRYQSRSGPCRECGKPTERKVVWARRRSTQAVAWRFDRSLKFAYWGSFKGKSEGNGKYTETLSLLGACWFTNREYYWKLGGLDEGHGSWGQMGTELACMYWLAGGRVICNQKTWFAHMFRTRGGDFGFPYPMKHHQTEAARKYSRDLWEGDNYAHAKHPFSWLIEKFNPPGWEDWKCGSKSTITDGAESKDTESPDPPVPSADSSSVQVAECMPQDEVSAPGSGNITSVSKGIVYYSDCRPDSAILSAAQRQLRAATNGHQIVSVTLGDMDFGDRRIVYANWERGYLTMFRQILVGLEECDADIVFLAEHDVLYHPSHFEFTPEREDVYYYNRNTWKVDVNDGKALFYLCDQTSGLCANRDLLLQHYRKRVERVEREGFTRKVGFEPGTHNRPERVDDYKAAHWMSEFPNIDLRHSHNLTQSRWSQDQFRNKKFCQGWKMADEVPGWGRTKGRMQEFLKEVVP
jgi:glycosyltransferase involved in cell wall biosynthesis